MYTDEYNPELRASSGTTPVDHPESTPLAASDLEPEMDVLSSNHLPALQRSAKRSIGMTRVKEITLEDRFVEQRWHRPYAEALVESDPAKKSRLIAAAEEAILNRYVEIAAAEEGVDLRHALDALAELKRGS
jgi:hypothetical protein